MKKPSVDKEMAYMTVPFSSKMNGLMNVLLKLVLFIIVPLGIESFHFPVTF